MQGTGKTYEHSGQTTEWEDILINKGITTKEDVLLGKGLNPEDYIKRDEPAVDYAAAAAQQRSEALNSMTLAELDELEEEDEFSNSHALDVYRQQRLNELKVQAVRNRFGEVRQIVKDDWIREVTESSNNCIVLVHLYEDALVQCQVLDEAMSALAARFKYLKFLRIKSTHAIENWPERNLPTLFIYDEGALRTQLVTLSSIGGLTAKAADLEWFLVQQGIITDSELTENPRSSSSGEGGTSAASDDDDDDSDDNGYNRRGGNTRKIKFGGARHGSDDDDD